jgi:hypothetical protein
MAITLNDAAAFQAAIEDRLGDVPSEVAAVLAAGLATVAASAGIAWPAIVPAVTAIATLGWTLWRKGVLLTPRQMRVVGLLRNLGPCSAATLAPLAAKDGMVPEDALDGVLRSLTEVETRDGTLVALAVADAQGFWRARGV